VVEKRDMNGAGVVPKKDDGLTVQCSKNRRHPWLQNIKEFRVLQNWTD
jgi:hypothetical protein